MIFVFKEIGLFCLDVCVCVSEGFENITKDLKDKALKLSSKFNLKNTN